MSDVARVMQTTVPDNTRQSPAIPMPPTAPDTGRVRTVRKKRKPAAKKAAVPKKRRPGRPKGALNKAPKRGRRGDVALDLQSSLALLGSLHRTDLPVFQALTSALSARGKPSRKRLLAALGKVFG